MRSRPSTRKMLCSSGREREQYGYLNQKAGQRQSTTIRSLAGAGPENSMSASGPQRTLARRRDPSLSDHGRRGFTSSVLEENLAGDTISKGCARIGLAVLVCPSSILSDSVLALRSTNENSSTCGPYIFSLSNAFAVTRIPGMSRAHMNGESPHCIGPCSTFRVEALSQRQLWPHRLHGGPWCISRTRLPTNNCASLPLCARLPNAPTSTSRTLPGFKVQMGQPPAQEKKCTLSRVSSSRRSPSRHFPIPCHQFLQLCVMGMDPHARGPSATWWTTLFLAYQTSLSAGNTLLIYTPHFDTCHRGGFLVCASARQSTSECFMRPSRCGIYGAARFRADGANLFDRTRRLTFTLSAGVYCIMFFGDVLEYARTTKRRIRQVACRLRHK